MYTYIVTAEIIFNCIWPVSLLCLQLDVIPRSYIMLSGMDSLQPVCLNVQASANSNTLTTTRKPIFGFPTFSHVFCVMFSD
jgi:hypothetical protein